MGRNFARPRKPTLMEQCLYIGGEQHQGRRSCHNGYPPCGRLRSTNVHKNVRRFQNAPATPAYPRCSICNLGNSRSHHWDATDIADVGHRDQVGSHVAEPGDKQCLPECLLLGHEACSTEDVTSKCRCKSQPRSPSHGLEQVVDRPSFSQAPVFAGTEQQVKHQLHSRNPRMDGQIVCGKGQCGTCRTV